MGICPICGRELDSSGFCLNCGYRVKFDPPAVCILKKYLTSPYLLVLLALTGVNLILSFFPTQQIDLAGVTVSDGSLNVEAVIMLISLLFLYLDGKKPFGERINPRGFKILSTYFVIAGSIVTVSMLVCTLLSALFGSFVIDYLNVFIADFGYVFTGAVAYVLAAVFFVIAVLSALIYFFIYKTVNAVRDIAVSGAPNNKISTFIIVIFFIGAAINLLSLITEGGNFLNVVKTLVDASTSVTMAIALFKLKKEMKELHNSLFPKI